MVSYDSTLRLFVAIFDTSTNRIQTDAPVDKYISLKLFENANNTENYLITRSMINSLSYKNELLEKKTLFKQYGLMLY